MLDAREPDFDDPDQGIEIRVIPLMKILAIATTNRSRIILPQGSLLPAAAIWILNPNAASESNPSNGTRGAVSAVSPASGPKTFKATISGRNYAQHGIKPIDAEEFHW